MTWTGRHAPKLPHRRPCNARRARRTPVRHAHPAAGTDSRQPPPRTTSSPGARNVEVHRVHAALFIENVCADLRSDHIILSHLTSSTTSIKQYAQLRLVLENERQTYSEFPLRFLSQTPLLLVHRFRPPFQATTAAPVSGCPAACQSDTETDRRILALAPALAARVIPNVPSARGDERSALHRAEPFIKQFAVSQSSPRDPTL